MAINKVYLASLLMTEQFQELLEELEKSRPTIPVYDFNNEHAVDEWKSKSNSQNGFDICLNQLKGI